MAYQKKENPKNNGGRPEKTIDKKKFELYCTWQCTKVEICDALEIDEKTLTKWCLKEYGLSFSDTFKKIAATGKASLRRMQWATAQKGNATMQIWLGKQYLEQRDKQELTGKDGGNIVIDSPREQIERRMVSIATRVGKKEDI